MSLGQKGTIAVVLPRRLEENWGAGGCGCGAEERERVKIKSTDKRHYSKRFLFKKAICPYGIEECKFYPIYPKITK